MSRVTIVILNYNGKHFLERFLPSVIEYSHPHQVVVVDNASVDDSVDYIRHTYPEVQVLELESNLGFSHGYNVALRKIKSDYYLLLNSDVEVTPGWLDPLVTMIEKDPKVGACQPKILTEVARDTFEYAGAAGGYIDHLGYPFCRGRLFIDLEKDMGQYDNEASIFWSSGACMLVRADLFHHLEGFDDEFFAHMEEIDLCWRIYHSGYKVKFCPGSHVYHVGGGTLPKTNPRKTYLNFRNGLALLYKNLPLRQVWWKLPLRMLLDIVASIKFLFFDSPAHALSVIRALLHFLIHLPYYQKKRTTTNQISGFEGEAPIYPKSIVFDYYILRNRKFSDLRANIPRVD